MQSNVSVKMFLRWKKNRCVIKHSSSRSHLTWSKTLVWIQLINVFFVCVYETFYKYHYEWLLYQCYTWYTVWLHSFFMCCSKCLTAATKKSKMAPIKNLSSVSWSSRFPSFCEFPDKKTSDSFNKSCCGP